MFETFLRKKEKFKGKDSLVSSIWPSSLTKGQRVIKIFIRQGHQKREIITHRHLAEIPVNDASNHTVSRERPSTSVAWQRSPKEEGRTYTASHSSSSKRKIRLLLKKSREIEPSIVAIFRNQNQINYIDKNTMSRVILLDWPDPDRLITGDVCGIRP